MIELETDKVKVDFELYPRSKANSEIISQYQQAIDRLPPIEVSKEGYILIDGFHRLRAHILEGKKTIKAELVDIPEKEILVYAIKKNNAHGYQLIEGDKKSLAIRLWKELSLENGERRKKISELLSVTMHTTNKWTRDIRDEEKDKTDQEILELWLSCQTQEEIAARLNITQQTIHNIINTKMGRLSQICNEPPDSLRIYDLWNFSTCDKRFGAEYPGRIPGQIVENLLWYYTKPFEIVVDPMVGSGTTIDVAKGMYRRVVGFDLQPVRKDIIKRDTIKDGFPEKFYHKDYKPSLVFVDPPYFTMKKDNYSKDAISNNSLEGFYATIKKLSERVHEVLKKGGYFAFLIQNQTEKDLPNGEPITHVFNCYDIIKETGFKLHRQINCPQSTQCFLPQQVNRAKKEVRALGVVRDLLIYEKVE